MFWCKTTVVTQTELPLSPSLVTSFSTCVLIFFMLELLYFYSCCLPCPTNLSCSLWVEDARTMRLDLSLKAIQIVNCQKILSLVITSFEMLPVKNLLEVRSCLCFVRLDETSRFMVHNVPVLSNCQVHCCSCSNRSCDLGWRLLCHHKYVQQFVFLLLSLDGTHSSVRRCAFHAARGSGWTVTEGLRGWIQTKHHLEKHSPERVLSWTVYLDISNFLSLGDRHDAKSTVWLFETQIWGKVSFLWPFQNTSSPTSSLILPLSSTL